ncbi:nicotinamide mononucleotide transporter [Arthrobacter pigmenti]
MEGLMDDGGTSLMNVLSTWLPVLSVALMLLFAVLAARRSMWSWAAAGSSVLVLMGPYLVTGPGPAAFGLSPLAFLTLLVPLLGWWNWHRSRTRQSAGKVAVRRARGKHYLIAGAILLIPALFSVVTLYSQGSFVELSPPQLALAGLGQLMRGLLFVALLGLALGLIEGWWLLLLDSAWYLVPAVLDLNAIAPPGVSVAAHTTMAVLHAGVIVAAVLGYRNWKPRVGASPQTAHLQGNL